MLPLSGRAPFVLHAVVWPLSKWSVVTTAVPGVASATLSCCLWGDSRSNRQDQTHTSSSLQRPVALLPWGGSGSVLWAAHASRCDSLWSHPSGACPKDLFLMGTKVKKTQCCSEWHMLAFKTMGILPASIAGFGIQETELEYHLQKDAIRCWL